jgi:hypothetical protein
MKANELRIGNYIGDKNDIAIVESIDKDGCMVQFINDEKQGFRISEPIKAIPLTEEWLLRFGFYKSDNYGNDEYRLDGYSYFRGSFYISDCDECGESVEINFVHELQNLYFALTKKELTMK